MTKCNQNSKRSPSRLDRVERKCDRILSELIIIRQQLNRRPGIDNAIERLHKTARKMRLQCEQERDYARSMFNSKFQEE